MKKPRDSASGDSTPPQRHHVPELIIDPPHHLATILSDSHHAQLQQHAVQKAHALMNSVMAQARGPTSDIGPRLVLMPAVSNSVIIGATDEQGIGIDLVSAGVVVQVEAWTPMAVGDTLELFWGTYPGTASVSKQITTPDELNKPVYLNIPSAIISAGTVSIVARVTRNGSGFLDVSPALSLLVKLDPPGGITPPPDINTNLAVPVLPPEVIANGVDATWSVNGVPVTIQPYPNMFAGDRIRLNWGSAYIERTVVQADVGNPVTLTIDDATIRSAGDSDALIVRYQVMDLVNNRSGWSPSVEIEVHVIDGALLPPEVNHTDDDGVIDLDLLGTDDVSVFVTALSPDFAIGDTVTLSWIGHTSTGAQVPYSDQQSVTRSPIQTLEFLIPNATVVALAQGDAVVSYSLQNGKTSKSVTVIIVGEAAMLPAPSIDGVSGGQLDGSLASATVIVPANPIFAPGDTITLIWSGVRADGTTLLYQPTLTVTGKMVNNDILIPVPGSEIATLAGGTLQVSYLVTHGDGTTLPASGVLTLRVGSGTSLLQRPTVDEAPDNATLDPDNVNVQATVRIPVYTNPDMEVGDRIDMYWVGSKGDSYTDWTTVSTITKGKSIPIPVDKDPYVDDNNGGTVTASYTVKRETNVWNSASLTLQVGVVLEIPAITSLTDSNGEVANGGATSDTTLTLGGTAEANETVELFDGAISLGVVSVGASSTWIRTLSGLAEGSHSFTVKALYGAQPVSLARTVTISETGIPTITSVKDSAGNVKEGGETTDTTIELKGTALDKATVEIFDGSTSLGTVTANANGVWTYTANGLAVGGHSFTAKALYGTGPVSSARTLKVVATVMPVITSVKDSKGDVKSGGTTTDTTVTLTGTAMDSATVQIFDGTTSLATVNVNASGVWTYTASKLALGSHSFTAKALYGTQPVSAAWTVKVEAVRVEPKAIVITEVDPFRLRLLLVKAISSVHVVVDYDGMQSGDTVTMVLQGSAAGDTQTTVVRTLGPITFTVAASAVIPNTNGLTTVFYTVLRAGAPGGSEVKSPNYTFNVWVDDTQIYGPASFKTGTTSYYRFYTQTSITLGGPSALYYATPRVLPSGPGEVIPSVNTDLVGSCVINNIGPQCFDADFATNVPGVSMSFFGPQHNNDPQGVWVGNPGFGGHGLNNDGAEGFIMFQRSGLITGGTIKAGVLGMAICGSNHLNFMGWQLMNDITIYPG